MSVRVRVRSNRLNQVASRLASEVGDAVDDTADEIARLADARAPVLTGTLIETTKSDEEGALHAEVGAGYHQGPGYWAYYQEFGTSRHGAQPFMVPAAQAGEAILREKTTDAVRRACS